MDDVVAKRVFAGLFLIVVVLCVAAPSCGGAGKRPSAPPVPPRPKRPEPIVIVKERDIQVREVFALRVKGIASACRLVTSIVTSEVQSTVTHRSWRGDVVASVYCPVHVTYAIDMGMIGDNDMTWDEDRGLMTVRVPHPRVLSVQADLEGARHEVSAGWGRTRARAGQFWLSEAVELIPEKAREVASSDQMMATAEDLALGEVHDLLQQLLRAVVEDGVVRVEYQ